MKRVRKLEVVDKEEKEKLLEHGNVNRNNVPPKKKPRCSRKK